MLKITPAGAARLAYKKPHEVERVLDAAGFHSIHTFSNQETDTQGFVAGNDSIIYVALRGTELPTIRAAIKSLFAKRKAFRDIKTDLMFRKVDSFLGGKVHRGFLAAAESVVSEIEYALDASFNGQKVIFTGHSLGAALAAILAIRCGSWGGGSESHLFGCPRIFNAGGALRYDVIYPYATRYTNNNDLVCNIPPAWMGYRHIGKPIYIDVNGNRHKNISWINRKIDKLKGRAENMFLDGLGDHDVSEYESLPT